MISLNIYLHRKNHRRALRRDRIFKDHLNPLEVYNHQEIKDLFRFERENILNLVNSMLEDLRHPTGRNCALSPLQQVCIGLRFYATGCMQLSLAAWINIDQSTVSRTVWHVSSTILRHYPNAFTIQTENSKSRFYEKYDIPNIIGCIDCTHVKILAPPYYSHPEEYINRKKYYSINVQALCDSDCVFIDVVAAWPGSVHDSRIFKNSDLCRRLVSGQLNGIILGDNGYGLTPYLMTPFLLPRNSGESLYNKVHKKARCTIERSFGQLKKRFYCLGSIIRCKLERIPTIIVACFILHNLAKSFNDPDPDGVSESFDVEENDSNSAIQDYSDAYTRRLGEQKRQEIVDDLLRNRPHM